MLTLVTSNASKYAFFAAELERLRIVLEPPREPLPEVQDLNFAARCWWMMPVWCWTPTSRSRDR